MEQKLYKRNIFKLFAITISNAFIFAYVVERLFGLERGISILEVQYITIIFNYSNILYVASPHLLDFESLYSFLVATKLENS